MRRILAIEADPRRQRVLSALVLDHVKADLVVVASVQAAITSIAEHAPDLILAPALLSPADEAELLSHMKRLVTAPHIQMVTVPALDMLADAPPEPTRRRGFFSPVFHRQPVSLGLQYDSRMVVAQIVDGLERARELRIEYAATLAYNEAASHRPRETSMVLAASGARIATDLEGAPGRRLPDQVRDERRVALRQGLGDVPWLSGISLSSGSQLQLINISRTGVLVETGSKFTPGSTTELCLSGPETNLVVPVRFVRSDVARIDGLGVRYHAAAAFARELDLTGPRRDVPATPPQALAGLFVAVLAGADDGKNPAHTRFADGLRQLIGARDVQVRTGWTGAAGGPETLYFDVPGDDRTRTTLQVMFDRKHDVTDAEFKLLKAAAWLTAAVLEFEKPASPPVERTQAMALIA